MEETLNFSSDSSNEKSVLDSVIVYIWKNGTKPTEAYQVIITSAVNSYKRVKEELITMENLSKDYFDKIKVYNHKGIEICDEDIGEFHDKDILFVSLNGEPFSIENYINEYELIKEIKKGENDTIYEAKHNLTNKKVAIKITKILQDNMNNITNLTREATFLTSLKNKNIIKVYNYFMYKDNFYVVMKLGKGGNLYEYLDTINKRLSEEESKKYFRQLYNAILYIHNNNIVHGNLKPSNVIFLDEKKTRLAIIDFKLSALSNGNSNEKIKPTNAPYISPEVILDDNINSMPCLDIWGLGIILYEMICGKNPFKGKNLDETVENIIHQNLGFPNDFKATKQCFNLIFGLLQKDFKKRIDIYSSLFEQWFDDNEYKLIPLKDYLSSDKVLGDSLFRNSKRTNSLNKGSSNIGNMIVRNSRRGKTLNMTGKVNIKKPNYFRATKSSLFKEK